MAFKLDDIIIDRIQMGFAEDFDGNPLYVLTQLSDATISITAETKDATDAQGTLIKRFYQGKSGEFTATNAMLNLNIVGTASGSGKVVVDGDATETSSTLVTSAVMPKIFTLKKGETADVTGYVEGTITVCELSSSGAMGTAYTQSTSASSTTFGLQDNTVTAPTAKTEDEDGNQIDVEQYVVKYDRTVTSGAYVINSADKFPSTIKLTLKALCVDPCSADTLRACYIVIPSFQVSPEVEISFTTDATLSYTGALQVDYCSTDKALYEIYIAAEDDDEE